MRREEAYAVEANRSTTPARIHRASAPQMPEPNAERSAPSSRYLVGTLSTLSRKHPGSPSAPNAFRSRSGRTAHFPNQQYGNAYPEPEGRRASQPHHRTSWHRRRSARGGTGDTGWQCRTCAGGRSSLREKYLARHENSRYWVDFADFNFFRLQPIDLYYVGGFGVMGWVDARAIQQCNP